MVQLHFASLPYDERILPLQLWNVHSPSIGHAKTITSGSSVHIIVVFPEIRIIMYAYGFRLMSMWWSRYITHAGSLLSTLYSMLGISTAGHASRKGTGSNHDQWLTGNITLPAGWDSVTIDRIFLGGIPYVATGVHGSRLAVKQLE